MPVMVFLIAMLSIIGPTGAGKNTFLNHMLLPIITAGVHWVVCFFPSAEAAIPLIAEAYAQMGDRLIPRLIVERLADTSHVIMRSVVQSAHEGSYYARKLANELALGAFLEVLAHNRPDFSNPTSRPILYRYSKLAYEAIQYCDVFVPHSWMPLALRARHPVQDFLIQHCTSEEVKAELLRISMFNVHDQIALLQPVENMLMPLLQNAVMESRTSRPPTMQMRDSMRRAMIYVVIADGVSLEIQRLIFAVLMEDVMDAVESPGFFVVDELNELGINEKFINHMRTKRVKGASIVSLLQHFAFQFPEHAEGFLNNCDRAYTCQSSPGMVDACAADMRGQLDRFRIHHVDESIRQQMNIEWIERVTEGKTKGPNGTSTSKTTSLIPLSIPQYIVDQRPVYESPRDQEFWLGHDIRQAGHGVYFVKPRLGQARIEYRPAFRNSWGYQEVMKARFEECVAKTQNHPEFEMPVVVPFPEIRRDGRQTNMRRNVSRRRGRGSR